LPRFTHSAHGADDRRQAPALATCDYKEMTKAVSALALSQSGVPEVENMQASDRVPNPTMRLGRKAALAGVFLWFFIGGIAHFAATDAEMRIVPPWLAAPRLLVLISGVFELLGAFGVLYRPTRNMAGWGLILLTIAVTPANIYMLEQASQYPSVPYWALVLRLPLQVALLVCIWWSTRPLKTPATR